MTPTEARPPAALDAAINQIRTTAASAAMRVAEMLGVQTQTTGIKINERELAMAAQLDLRRNLATFQQVFHEALREKVSQQLTPRADSKRKLESADWQTLSLVNDSEVEERMNFVRLGQMISHECEWQLRDLAAYMGTVLGTGRADEESNPVRAEIVGSALYRAIESVSNDSESRKILTREFGIAMAHAMPACYADILQGLQERGVQPVLLTVRSVEGPGNQLGVVNSGYMRLRDGRNSQRSGLDEPGEPAPAAEDDLLAAHRRALQNAFPGVVDSVRGGLASSGAEVSARSGDAGSRRADSSSRAGGGPNSGRGGESTRSGLGSGSGSHRTSRGRPDSAADAQLMTLLRRLATTSTRSGELDAAGLRGRTAGSAAAGRSTGGAELGPSSGYPAAGGSISRRPGGADGHAGDRTSTMFGAGMLAHGTDASVDSEQLTKLMAVNLIRAHREELMQASTGKLDHMVIDVVGSLFDQILSDSRVPPQMAREIARLQLPVLRVALNDSSFFSTRRHPVRRFVNRIASLACAFDDFDEGPGAQFLGKVRKLVGEIVEGDFDQTDLYAAKLTELEAFIARQNEGEVEQTGTVTTLDAKESELRVQQRYMLQLRGALAPLALPGYLQDFLPQVWSQAMVLAARRDGVDSDRLKRYRRVGCDLVMSVQPKGSPTFRKKFLMQLPTLMKDLNEGIALIGWPDAARKAFFGKLLPAHAESLKGQPMSELDHNMMVKQLEAVFAMAVPQAEAFSRIDAVPEVDPAVVEQRFTPEEVVRVGLVSETAVDWSVKVALEAPAPAGAERPAAPAVQESVAGAPPAGAGDAPPSTSTSPSSPGAPAGSTTHAPATAEAPRGPPTTSPGEVGEPTHGAQLIDHIKLGFAYQMHLKNEWQKVRLAHVSSGRSFFVFTRGGKHHETISMTSRMVARMCETGRLRAVESEYLMERATHRARQQLAELTASTRS